MRPTGWHIVQREDALGEELATKFSTDRPGRQHPPGYSLGILRKGFYFIEDVIKPDELAELQIDAKTMITRAPVNRDAKADAKGRPNINRGGNLQPFSKWWFGVHNWLYKPGNHATKFWLSVSRKFGLWVACNSSVIHHSRLRHIPRITSVHQAAVVPDNQVARMPAMLINTWLLTSKFHQIQINGNNRIDSVD